MRGSLISLLVVAAAFATGCPNRNIIDDGSDAGPSGPPIIACEDASECPDETYDCLGVCLKRCGADDACDLISPTYYCADSGYCEPGCRDRFNCDDPDTEVCVDGLCRAREGAGDCVSKCDCEGGEVCNGGICTDPPATCGNSDDCGRGPVDRCEAFLCNGFTAQCFDPDPQPCNIDGDCAGRPGCQDGCVCTPSQQCVPQGACTIASENVDCGPGFFCTDTLVCDVLPACVDDTQCEALGLECNVGLGVCERPLPCAGNQECVPPQSFCNLAQNPSFCAVPTCINGGITCQPAQECSVDGRCVTAGTGGPCNGNVDCSNDPWPATQFCSFATGTGVCTDGCRSNASCPANQECNGANDCVPIGGAGGQVGGSCTADTDCSAGLVCGVLTNLCTETCFNVGEACNGGADCCSLTGSATCDLHPLGFGLIGYCSFN